MDPLGHLDLLVQGLVGHGVELSEYLVHSLVTGRLTDDIVLAHAPAVVARVVTADRAPPARAGAATGVETAAFSAGALAAALLAVRFAEGAFLAGAFAAAALAAAVFLAGLLAAALAAAVFLAGRLAVSAVGDAERRVATSLRSFAVSACASSSFWAGTSPSRLMAASTSLRTSAVRLARLATVAANSSSASALACDATLVPVAMLETGSVSNP